MDQEQEPKMMLPRGIYLLPNLLTTAGLFAGFYAVVAAMRGLFDVAAIAIFVAMVADGLDGRVARMTNTQSAFGAQYDSMSDMVAFGVAPALVMYSWVLAHLGKLGWLISFWYAAATALRLARFNTQIQDSDKRYFQGLSCTAAAGLIAGTVWLGSAYEFYGMLFSIAMGVLTTVIGGLMVSSMRYYSFKVVELKGKVPFITVVLTVLVIVAVALEPAELLFTIFFLYALSGVVGTLWQIRQVRKKKV